MIGIVLAYFILLCTYITECFCVSPTSMHDVDASFGTIDSTDSEVESTINGSICSNSIVDSVESDTIVCF